MGMTVTEAVRHRYSTRGYRSDPVPEEVIRSVLDVARWAPSNNNVQPWHVAVVSGEAKDRLSARLCELFDAGVQGERDFPLPSIKYEGVYQERRRACGFGYYATMGVERDDMSGRAAIARKNFEFFDAPHVAFFSMPLGYGINNGVDMGIFLGTVMLVMQEHGLACIAQGALAGHPGPVREIADIPDGNGILFGMSFGYEDPEAHINTVRMPREDLDGIATFVS